MDIVVIPLTIEKTSLTNYDKLSLYLPVYIIHTGRLKSTNSPCNNVVVFLFDNPQKL